MNNNLHVLDYLFFFILFLSTVNVALQVWMKYFKVNKNTVDGTKLVNTYIAVETIKQKRAK